MLTMDDREEIKRMIVEEFAASTPAPMATEQVDSNLVVDVTARAMEVFGNREKALRWLKTPVRSLADRTPLSLLNSSKGAMQVRDTLGRVEHGVW
jgi:putative toxin-antitoxin system antitoxin component (TIGR02293 family)